MIKPTNKFILAVLAATVCALHAPAQTNTTPAAPASTSAAIAAPADTNSSPVDKMTQLFGDPVIAKGKGVEVKQSDLDAEMTSLRARVAAQGRSIPPEYEDMIERQALDRLINLQLLLATANDDDRAKGQEVGEKRADEMLQHAGSQEALDRQLKSLGLTYAQVKARVIQEATGEARVERELKVVVTDADAKKFYDDHPSEFEQPEMVRVAHILISTRDPATGEPLSDDQKGEKLKLAEDLLKRVKAGEDFATLVKQYSDDPGSKDSGGEYKFPRGRMVPEFEAAAFSLNTNQISDIVTTQFGYHIIKMLEKIPAQKVAYDTVASDIKDALKARAIMKQLPDLTARLNKEANVEIVNERLKNVVLPPPSDASADDPDKSASPDSGSDSQK